MKKLHLILPILLLISISGLSQTITGTVVDSDTNEPLSYTNIGVLGKGAGTISNLEGKFVLDISRVNADDMVVFSFVGYETYKIKVADLSNDQVIQLKRATINLLEIQISDKNLTAKQILDRVEENYEKNYPPAKQKQRIFLHQYDVVPFDAEKQIAMKKSDFEGLDKNTFDDLMKLMPKEFIEYQDAIVDLYQYEGQRRMVPIEAISLSEGSQEEVFKEMENKIKPFVESIEESVGEEDVYYKFRTGIIGKKFDTEEFQDEDDNEENPEYGDEDKEDSLYYSISTKYVLGELHGVMNSYTDIESKNWQFLNKRGKYKYNLEGITIYNDMLVYELTFKPKGGLFQGVMYVTTDDFAITKLDFEYAPGKSSENIQLLGFGHSVKYKRGQVIWEKLGDGYFPKYIYAKKIEYGSIDRTFIFMKKKKRFLINKKLNEMKFRTNIAIDIEGTYEMLVLNSEEINEEQFEKVQQPKKTKFKKEYVYSKEMWNNPTVIAPTSELEQYKRTE